MAITEDFTIYFNSTDGMAVDATYTAKQYAHDSSQSTTVPGIFDNEYIEINDVSSSRPIFMFESSKITSPVRGDKLTINSIVYTVKEIQPDGTGVTTFVLEVE